MDNSMKTNQKVSTSSSNSVAGSFPATSSAWQSAFAGNGDVENGYHEVNNNCRGVNDNNKTGGKRRHIFCPNGDDLGQAEMLFPVSASNSSRCDSLNNFDSRKSPFESGLPVAEKNRILELAKGIGNEFRGEFIVIPNHLIEDEDQERKQERDNLEIDLDGDNFSSNSEDCVYAYRGENLEEQQQDLVVGDHEADNVDDDDETDFLEMDFDPEPNSEQESFSNSGFVQRFNLPCPNQLMQDLDEPVPVPCSPEFPILRRISKENDNNPENNHQSFNNICISPIKINNSVIALPVEPSFEAAPVIPEPKITGTKPKIRPNPYQNPEPGTSKQNTIEKRTVPSSTQHKSDAKPCQDCNDFCYLDSDVSKAWDLVDGKVKCWRHSKKIKNQDLEEIIDDRLSLTDNEIGHKPQAQISTSDFDETTIFNSLSIIGIKVDRDRLHDLLNEHRKRLDSSRTLVEYLVNFSKSKSDHKSLIHIIRQSCSEEESERISIEYKPLTKEPEMLELDTRELLSRWSPAVPLNDLFRINNRHFHASNVPGKVVNTLRQVQPKSTNVASILIPSFYRAGFLIISKATTPRQQSG